MATGKKDLRPRYVDTRRREVLGGIGAGALASTFGGIFSASPTISRAQEARVLRWGVVGTGRIANRVAPMIQLADSAELIAVSSREMATARQFANAHGLRETFDSWADLCASSSVDAIYVATPTFVREEICIAAAKNGKHVLGEKPFANLPSLKRITKTCRDNMVGFMDGTHFVHHPRTSHIKATLSEKLGRPWSVASAFQFGLSDTSNIRLQPDLEPYGAIGDAGWYNMRAAVEFLPDDVKLTAACAYVRRHSTTNAVVRGSGAIAFDDDSTTTWNCGFESGVLNQDLRISTARGVIRLDDFVLNRAPKTARYQLVSAAESAGSSDDFEVSTAKPPAALMFEDFAAMIGVPTRVEASIRASERTQELLDAIWESSITDGKV